MCVKEFNRTAAILLAILETESSRKPNYELVKDINETDACVKFKQNLLRMKKVIACQRTGQMEGQTDRVNTIGLLPTIVGEALVWIVLQQNSKNCI